MDIDYSEDPKDVGGPTTPPAHYYGDHVRRLFLAGGAVMILSFPFFLALVQFSAWIAILFALAISIFAGIQNPRHPWTTYVNIGVSILAFCFLEYQSATFYTSDLYADGPLFFWILQLLALIFFFAIYFSMKSTRATEKDPLPRRD